MKTASFLQRCLQRDPMNRASIEELLMHPFLGGYEATASICSSSSTKSTGATITADASDDEDGRNGSAGSESTIMGMTKNTARNIEPEPSPTVKSEEEVYPVPMNGARRPVEGQHRSRGPDNADGDNHAEEEEALLQPRQQPDKLNAAQHLQKHDTSPERFRPSRIPR